MISRRSQHQLRVMEFMRQAGQETPTEPTVPSDEVRLLRCSLLFEEAVRELIHKGYAVNIRLKLPPSRVCDDWVYLHVCEAELEISSVRQPNLVEIADGHGDVSVVNVGGMAACGISDVELLGEVDRSNLSKFDVPHCGFHGQAMTHEAMGRYICMKMIGPQELCGEVEEGPYLSDSGKWEKGPQYSPADIEGVLERQKSSAKQRAEDDGVTYDEGGMYVGEPIGRKGRHPECGNCRQPLSDDLVKRLETERRTILRCPNCTKPVILKDVVYA